MASSSLVPQNDPTLMFANSGMAIQKSFYWFGNKRLVSGRQLRRNVCGQGASIMISKMLDIPPGTTLSLKCGNFSFGDYFKENAIELA